MTSSGLGSGVALRAAPFVFALSLVLGLTTPAHGVPPACTVPGDHATINDAVDDPACETVTVAAGTYAEGPVTIEREVSVFGPNAGVDPNTDPRGTEAEVTGAGNGFEIAVQPDATVVIDGFEIDVDGSGVVSTIDDEVVDDNTDTSDPPVDAIGEMETDMTIAVVNNIVDDTGGRGVDVIDGAEATATVSNNQISTLNDGVHISPLLDLPCESTCVTYNPSGPAPFPEDELFGREDDPILVTTGSGDVVVHPTRGQVDISDNEISALGDGVEIVHTSEVTSTGNTIVAVEDGIHLRDVKGLDQLIGMNTITAGDEGILLEDTKGTANLGRPVDPAGGPSTVETGDPTHETGVRTLGTVTVAGNQIDVSGASGDDGTDDEDPGGREGPGACTMDAEDGTDAILLCDVQAATVVVDGNQVGDAGDDGIAAFDTNVVEITDNEVDAMAVTFAGTDECEAHRSGLPPSESFLDPDPPDRTPTFVDEGAGIGILVCGAEIAPSSIRGNTIGEGDTGIYLEAAQADDRLRGNPRRPAQTSLSDLQVHGAIPADAAPTVIADNAIEGPIAEDGIGLLDTGLTEVTGNEVEMGDSSRHAINGEDLKGVDITGNTIVHVATGEDGISLNDVQQTSISGNEVVVPGDDGVFVENAHSTTIDGNLIRDMGAAGIDANDTSGDPDTGERGLTVTGNTILRPDGPGVIFQACQQTVIPDGFLNSNADGPPPCDTSGDILIADNLIRRAGAPFGAIHVGDVGFDRHATTATQGDLDPVIDEVIPTNVEILGNHLLNSDVGVHVDPEYDSTFEGDGNDTFTPDPAVGMLDVHFNRIVGNDIGLLHEGDGDVDAQNNWWGCNGGPGAAGCDSVDDMALGGGVDFDPWLVLLLEYLGGTDVQASLTTNSDGADTSAAGTVPDGIPVDFSTTLGAMDPASTTTTDGVATSTMTECDGSARDVTSDVDNQSVTESIICELPPPPCIGTPGDDHLVIDASCDPDGDGVVHVELGDGNDTVCIQQGTGLKVNVIGGSGDDFVSIGDCSTARAGGGSARPSGPVTTLRFAGGPGADTAIASRGPDVLLGGPGRDVLTGRAGPDLLKGAGGRDTLRGQRGRDSLRGGPGKDLLKAGKGNDLCRGGKGPDTLKGCET